MEKSPYSTYIRCKKSIYPYIKPGKMDVFTLFFHLPHHSYLYNGKQ